MTPTLLALALTASAPQLKEPPKKEPPIIGRWLAHTVVVNGMEQKGNGLDYEFTKDGRWVISQNGKESVGTARTYSVNPKTNPPTIDLNERADGQAYPGVFKVDGNTLTVTFRIDGKERPADVDARGAGYMSLIMTRVKKD
jgi:uncharacterized protein (TIGR03067 family)